MAARAAVVELATRRGTARVAFSHAVRPRATLLLGHGAGAGVEAADLQLLAARLPVRGIDVGLVEQPWRVAGRKVADRPAWLDDAWRDVLDGLGRRRLLRAPLVVGGRSAGARVAARTGFESGAAGVLALAFPLHPPGRPEATRAEELVRVGERLPVLVVQGGSDAFGDGRQVRAGLPESILARPAPPLPASGVVVLDLPGADHALRMARRGPLAQSEAAEILAEFVGWWVGAVTRTGAAAA